MIDQIKDSLICPGWQRSVWRQGGTHWAVVRRWVLDDPQSFLFTFTFWFSFSFRLFLRRITFYT